MLIKRFFVNRSGKQKDLTRLSEVLTGADDEARTRYLHLGKVALYQMSYIRILFARNDIYYISLYTRCQHKNIKISL